MNVYLWIALTVIFIIAEVATTNIVSIWFALGALAATLVTFVLPDSAMVQIVVFIAVSCVTMYFTRPALSKVLNKKTPTNMDMLIGTNAKAISDISPDAPGRAKAGGLDWLARSKDTIKAGESCRITAIEGAAIIVEKICAQTVQ